ncbi:MAG: hypothetical protein HRU18_02745 [Pseudoalteromonas sp.]|uniref:hypothetical protein n=1 Tax=Pseudoalteromonas sp. TaxID=53249 RepID=UPI001DE96414|nr:hypothetical protein [Pseudoalteromonas sp.]NRA77102.1 hypothetical protein [Pseudoalteromonas sp.]
MDKNALITTYKSVYKSVHGKAPKSLMLADWTVRDLKAGINTLEEMLLDKDTQPVRNPADIAMSKLFLGAK